MTHPNRVRLSKLSLGLIVALAAAPVFAQSTSASVTGQVVSADGAPVAGAEVIIRHTESGTVSRVTTDANGRYIARGLRVGGPYTVEASAASGSDTETGINLSLDITNSVDLQLSATATPGVQTLEGIQVTAQAMSPVFTPETTGAATIVTRQQIEALPSVRRSLEDYARLDPRIVQVDKERGGIAAAGQNNRYNNIRVDGVPTNDNFGLNDSGVPALNQPIVIDWIQEFNISVSNYDVTQGDFVGANINAVTKSGTNEFHGSLYGIFRDDSMIGDYVGSTKRPAPFKQETNWGAYVGGPIIKDRLFFFVGYEEFEREAEAVSTGILGSGALNEFRITQAQLDQVRAAAAAYGATNIGSFDPINNISNSDKKVIAKLDWNITDTQRAAFRYNKTEGDVLRQNTGLTTLQADSNRFVDNISFENWAGMLYSDWSENFSTEANVSYSEYRSLPTSFSNFPQVSITVPNAAPTGGTGTILFGQERSRQSNQLEVDTWTAFFAGNLYAGDHEIKFGFDYEKSDIYNLFLQDTVGNYTFGNTGTPGTSGYRTGLDNFLAGRYTSFLFQRSRTGNNADAAARFKVGNLGLFVQDTWTVNDNLTLIYGIRADQTEVDGTPAANAQFLADYGFDNTTTPDGNWTVSPRFGFNYTIDGDLITQFRGGIGLFVGSAPGVWLSNSFSNPGVVTESYSINASTGAPLPPNAFGSGSPTLPTAAPAQLVNAMDNDFKQPTIWKANLGVDQELAWYGLTAGAELLVTKTRYGVHYINYGLGDPTGVLPDGRNHYWSNLTATATNRAGCLLVNPALPFNRSSNPCRYTDAIVLTNTTKGHSENLTLSLEKPWRDGWSARLAYTLGSSREVSPGTSSVARSTWQNRSVFNQNADVDDRSNYEINHRLTFNASKRFEFFGETAPTTVSMFYEGRNGRPYTYVFNNDANGDGIFGNDVFYVPTGPGDVTFTANSSPADQAAFWNYIASNTDLATRRGLPMGRNSARSPWRNIIDVRIQQDFPLGFGDVKGQVFLDIENFGNLLNKKWGQVEEAGFPYTLNVVNYAGVNAAGRYQYDASGFANRNMELPYRNFESRWAAQIGLRIDF